MKTFIVFLAFLFIFVSFTIYGSDLDYYIKLQNHLKALAEDAASGAALIIDEEAYSEGYFIINKADAQIFVEKIIEKALMDMPQFRNGKIGASVLFFDDETGYEGAEEYGLDQGLPSVVVKLVYENDNIFHLSVIDIHTIERTAVYRWEDPV